MRRALLWPRHSRSTPLSSSCTAVLLDIFATSAAYGFYAVSLKYLGQFAFALAEVARQEVSVASFLASSMHSTIPPWRCAAWRGVSFRPSASRARSGVDPIRPHVGHHSGRFRHAPGLRRRDAPARGIAMGGGWAPPRHADSKQCQCNCATDLRQPASAGATLAPPDTRAGATRARRLAQSSLGSPRVWGHTRRRCHGAPEVETLLSCIAPVWGDVARARSCKRLADSPTHGAAPGRLLSRVLRGRRRRHPAIQHLLPDASRIRGRPPDADTSMDPLLLDTACARHHACVCPRCRAMGLARRSAALCLLLRRCALMNHRAHHVVDEARSALSAPSTLLGPPLLTSALSSVVGLSICRSCACLVCRFSRSTERSLPAPGTSSFVSKQTRHRSQYRAHDQ